MGGGRLLLEQVLNYLKSGKGPQAAKVHDMRGIATWHLGRAVNGEQRARERALDVAGTAPQATNRCGDVRRASAASLRQPRAIARSNTSRLDCGVCCDRWCAFFFLRVSNVRRRPLLWWKDARENHREPEGARRGQSEGLPRPHSILDENFRVLGAGAGPRAKGTFPNVPRASWKGRSNVSSSCLVCATGLTPCAQRLLHAHGVRKPPTLTAQQEKKS